MTYSPHTFSVSTEAAKTGRSASASRFRAAGQAKPRREGRRGSVVKRGLFVAGMAGLLGLGYLGGGFIRFTQEVAHLTTPARVERSDGIVVLTGGAMRLDQAIGLLKEGRAKRLLISGVNPATSIATLSKLTETDRALFDCCVDLDYDALNTIGNAEMTDRWAQRQGFQELILVTSDYHMPRTLLEFESLAHVPVIRPYPVARTDLWSDGEMPSGLGLKVLLTEYAKLLAARLRLSTGIEAPAGLTLATTAAKRAS